MCKRCSLSYCTFKNTLKLLSVLSVSSLLSHYIETAGKHSPSPFELASFSLSHPPHFWNDLNLSFPVRYHLRQKFRNTLKWQTLEVVSFPCRPSQFTDFIGRLVHQKQYSQGRIQKKQWDKSWQTYCTDVSCAVYFCKQMYVHLQHVLHLHKHSGNSVCVCLHSNIWASAGFAAEQNETKQSRADLRYHPQAGCRSLSLSSVTCWSSYNYSSHPHPSRYCCAVHWAYSLSGSAVLHKETITKSKQALSTKGVGVEQQQEEDIHPFKRLLQCLFFIQVWKSVMTTDTQKVVRD